MSFTNYMVQNYQPSYSNYQSLGVMAAKGCSDPARETPLYKIYTMDELYDINIKPRECKKFQVANRYRTFPLDNEVMNKSSNLHTGTNEVYYNLNDSPNKCFYKSCGELNEPVYIEDKLRV